MCKHFYFPKILSFILLILAGIKILLRVPKLLFLLDTSSSKQKVISIASVVFFATDKAHSPVVKTRANCKSSMIVWAYVYTAEANGRVGSSSCPSRNTNRLHILELFLKSDNAGYLISFSFCTILPWCLITWCCI